MGFVKIHDAILNSSILEEDVIVRWLWICLLVSCDRNGNVYGTPKALARRANVTLPQFNKALKVLMKPDKDSTSSDEEGRRILAVSQNLYNCVNYQHYRGLKEPEEVREQARIRKQRQRERERAAAEGVTPMSHDVQNRHDKAEADAEAEAEADTSSSKKSSSSRKDDDEIVKFVLEFWKKEDLRPRLRSISPLRRTTLLARAREYEGLVSIKVALDNRANSRFLCYEIFNGKGAPFDWVFGPKNFSKVIDGNYNDTPGGKPGKGGKHSEYDEDL